MKNSFPLPKPFSPRLLFTFAILSFFSLLLLACNAASPATPTPTLSSAEAQGKATFNLHCATCHSTSPDVVIVGPSMAGIATRAGERVPGQDANTYLQTSILKPNAYLVPGFPDSMLPDLAKQLTSEEFDAIIAYLLTLK